MSEKPSTHQVAIDGIKAVVTELTKRGLTHSVTKEGRKTYIVVSSGNKTIRVLVKAKLNRGNWHSDIREGRATHEALENAETYWVFVNLNSYESTPIFWVVPDSWIRNDIFIEHKKYLERYGGHRKKTNDSTHHSISEARLTEWEDKWDFLGTTTM